MFYSCEEGSISFFVLDFMIESISWYEIVDNLAISFGAGKMERNFSFGFLEMIEQLFDTFVLLKYGLFFILDSFLEIDEVEFDLGKFLGGDGINDLFVEFGDELVFFHFWGVHEYQK